MDRDLVTAIDPQSWQEDEDDQDPSGPFGDVISLQPGQKIPETGWWIKKIEDMNRRCSANNEPHTLENCPEKHDAAGIRQHCEWPSDSPPPKVHLSREDLVRWQMAFRAVSETDHEVRLLNGFPFHFKDSMPPKYVSWVDSSREHRNWIFAFVPRIRNWPRFESLGFWHYFGFSSAALVYGGLHALAWSSSFRTPREQLLWQISSCTVMGTMPITLFYMAIGEAVDDYVHSLFHPVILPTHAPSSTPLISRRVLEFVGKALLVPYFALFVLAILFYLLARAYLVVESFISLSHLSAGVYEVPQWTTDIPHIS